MTEEQKARAMEIWDKAQNAFIGAETFSAAYLAAASVIAAALAEVREENISEVAHWVAEGSRLRAALAERDAEIAGLLELIYCYIDPCEVRPEHDEKLATALTKYGASYE